MDVTELPDGIILMAYREWSEQIYCASFESAEETHIAHFRTWLKSHMARDEREDYEVEMLEMFRRQEREDDN